MTICPGISCTNLENCCHLFDSTLESLCITLQVPFRRAHIRALVSDLLSVSIAHPLYKFDLVLNLRLKNWEKFTLSTRTFTISWGLLGMGSRDCISMAHFIKSFVFLDRGRSKVELLCRFCLKIIWHHQKAKQHLQKPGEISSPWVATKCTLFFPKIQ